MKKLVTMLCLLLPLTMLGQSGGVTPNLQLVLPTGNQKTWGPVLNNDLTIIDTKLGVFGLTSTAGSIVYFNGVAWVQFAGNTNAATPCFSENSSGVPAWVACGSGGGGSGTVTSVALTVPAWLSVAGSPITVSGTLAVTAATGQAPHTFIATGAGTSYGPVTMTTLDEPLTTVNVVGNLSPLFTAAIANQTLSFTLSTFTAHTFYGNNTGSTGAPSNVTIGTGDLPFTYSGTGTKLGTVTTLTGTTLLCGDGSGNITSSGCPTTGAGSVTQNGSLVTLKLVLGGNNGTSDVKTDTVASSDGAGNVTVASLSTTGTGPDLYTPITDPTISTVAGLPGSPVDQQVAIVTDCNTTTIGATCAGGGGNKEVEQYSVSAVAWKITGPALNAWFASSTTAGTFKFYNGTSLVTVATFSAALSTTAAASDNVTINGVTANSKCSLTATNASAATNIATSYVSAKIANQITVTHTATGGMGYDILCSAN